MQAFDVSVFDKSLSHNVNYTNQTNKVAKPVQKTEESTAQTMTRVYVQYLGLACMLAAQLFILLYVPLGSLGTYSCFALVLSCSYAHNSVLVSLASAILVVDGLQARMINIIIYFAILAAFAARLRLCVKTSFFSLPLVIISSTLVCIKLMSWHRDMDDIVFIADIVFLCMSGATAACLVYYSMPQE